MHSKTPRLLKRRPLLLGPPSLLAALGVLLGALSACQDTEVILPASLKGPVSMAVAQGEVCLRLDTISEEGLLGTRIDACRAPALDPDALVRERGAIGLVANLNQDRVAVVALHRQKPALVDLDLATPGVSHIEVGRRPIVAAASPTGEVGYALNEVDRDISVLNLWAMESLTERIKLPDVPIDMAVHPQSGLVIAATVSQDASSALSLHPGVRCALPDGASLPLEVGQIDPEQGCEGLGTEPTRLRLQGTIRRVALDPIKPLAYVLYADRPYLSVVALDEQGFDQRRCVTGDSAPCELDRIGLTAGCADGIDNDQDGLIDQQDPQCYDPLGGESSEQGVSVLAMGACADGIDNDQDGLIDRLDLDCRLAAQSSEDGAEAPDFDPAPTICGDGLDNDQDGLIDQQDPDCYGRQGQSEEPVPSPGFSELSVDEHGLLAYVLHPVRREVIVVDLAQRRVIQAPLSGSVTDPFALGLGVAIGRAVTPTSVQAIVRRVMRRDPRPEYASSHALFSYDLGALITGDNGFVYFVSAAEVDCEVWETSGLLSDAEFYLRPELLSTKLEAQCLKIPERFETDRVDVAPSCEEFILCRDCQRRGAGGLERCAPCDRYADEQSFEAASQVCDLDERLRREGLVVQAFNPRFEVLDAAAPDALQQGTAQCEMPERLVADLTQYLQRNPQLPQIASCGSPLLSQPLSVTVAERGAGAEDDFITAQRLDLPEQRTLRLLMDEQGAVTEQLVVDTHDYATREQEWRVTYEGVLPGTKRSDGLAGSEGRFDTGALDPCLSDVRVGDLLVIETEPGTQTGGVPSACRGLSAPDDRPLPGAWREYEILKVSQGELTLGVIEQEGAGPALTARELPTEACFPRGLSYAIRAQESWIVVGSGSGIASGRVLQQGVCVPGNGADKPRVQSRVQGGERFIGPQVSFYMTEAVVGPVRDASYTIEVRRNFEPATLPGLGEGLSSGAPAASDLGYVRLFSAAPRSDGSWPQTPSRRDLITVVDPTDGFVLVRTTRTTDDPIKLF